MSNLPKAPKLSDGPPICISKREIFSLDCPKCKSPLDVTDLNFGTNIECPSCNNVTWRPEFKPKWWFRLRYFLITTIISFILGFSTSFIANVVYDNYQEHSVKTENLENNNEH
jgi:hypothetical protein